MDRDNALDFTLLFVTVVLVIIGIIMVFSSSSASAYYAHGDSYYYLKRQMMWAVLGFISMMVLSKIDYEKYDKMSKYILMAGLVSLMLVFIPGLGVTLNGATRWISIGGHTIQPSEFAKLAIIIYTASALNRKKEDLRTFLKGVLPFLIVAGIAFGLIMLQPDFSTAVSIVAIVLVMIFIAGANIGHLIGLSLPAFAALIMLIISEPYRLVRWTSFLDPSRTGAAATRQYSRFMPSVRAAFRAGAWPQQAEVFLHTAAAKRLHILHHRGGTGLYRCRYRDIFVYAACMERDKGCAARPGLFRMHTCNRYNCNDSLTGDYEYRGGYLFHAGHRNPAPLYKCRRFIASFYTVVDRDFAQYIKKVIHKLELIHDEGDYYRRRHRGTYIPRPCHCRYPPQQG